VPLATALSVRIATIRPAAYPRRMPAAGCRHPCRGERGSRGGNSRSRLSRIGHMPWGVAPVDSPPITLPGHPVWRSRLDPSLGAPPSDTAVLSPPYIPCTALPLAVITSTIVPNSTPVAKQRTSRPAWPGRDSRQARCPLSWNVSPGGTTAPLAGTDNFRVRRFPRAVAVWPVITSRVVVAGPAFGDFSCW
jgi:hypothetical protein